MKNWSSFQTVAETTLFLFFGFSIVFKWDKWEKKLQNYVFEKNTKKIQNNNTKNKLRKRPQTEMKSKLELTKINEERRNYAWIRVHVFHCVVCHICVCVCVDSFRLFLLRKMYMMDAISHVWCAHDSHFYLSKLKLKEMVHKHIASPLWRRD